MAFRCVRLSGGRYDFGVGAVDGGNLNGYDMYHSDGNADGGAFGLFPVVTLKSGVISGDATEGYVFSLN